MGDVLPLIALNPERHIGHNRAGGAIEDSTMRYGGRPWTPTPSRRRGVPWGDYGCPLTDGGFGGD